MRQSRGTLVASFLVAASVLACGARRESSATAEEAASTTGPACVPELWEYASKFEPEGGLLRLPRDLATDGEDPFGPWRFLRLTPGVITGVENARNVSVGNATACALVGEGGFRCWSLPVDDHRIGMPESTERQELARVLESPPLANMTRVAVGADMACAIHGEGNVTCWWPEKFPERRARPREEIDGAVELSLDGEERVACALTRDRRVACWGDEVIAGVENGYVGGATGHEKRKDVRAIAVGGRSVCLLGASIECAGEASALNDWLSSLGRVMEVAIARGLLCAVTSDGAVRCRVFGEYHRDENVPVARELERLTAVRRVVLGHELACALFIDGTAKCLGKNENGAVGDETLEGRSQPTPVRGLQSAKDIAAGRPACALLENGSVACWGYFAAAERPRCE